MDSNGGYWGVGYWHSNGQSGVGWDWSATWRDGWSGKGNSKQSLWPNSSEDSTALRRVGDTSWTVAHSAKDNVVHWLSQGQDQDEEDWEGRRPTMDDCQPAPSQPTAHLQEYLAPAAVKEDPWHAGADPWGAWASTSAASRSAVDSTTARSSAAPGAAAAVKMDWRGSDAADPWAKCTLRGISDTAVTNGVKLAGEPRKSASVSLTWSSAHSPGAASNSTSVCVGESTWHGPASSGGHRHGQLFAERAENVTTAAAPQKFTSGEHLPAGGGSHLAWQDDFTGPGHEPLKGKYFNDVIIEKQSGGEILAVVDQSMNEFSVVNAVTALHRLAKSGDAQAWRRDPRIKYLNRRITKMFASAKRDEIEKKETGRRVPGNDWVYYIDTRSLTNAAWAFAQLHLRHDELMEAVSEETCKKIYDSNAQQLAIMSWSFAKMLRVDLPLMQTLAEETTRRINEFNSQHLMNFVWGCAKVKFLHIEVMMAVAGMAMTLLDDFTPQHLSITAWAFATLGFRHRKLMEAIAAEVVKTIRAFRPQNIANTAWAFATLEIRHGRLMEVLAQAAIPQLADFSQQNLTNLIWSFSSLRIYHEQLFSVAAEQVVNRTHELDSQGLSMTASAFATLGVLNRPLFEAISQASVQLIACFAPRDLENMVMSFAVLGLCPPDLLEAVASQSMLKLKDFTSLDLASTAWAFAAAGHLNECLMGAIAARSISVIAGGSFPSQALAYLAWGFTTLSVENEALMNAISSEVLRKLDRQDLEHLVTLVDVGLPCRHILARRLGLIIYHFIRALPLTPEGWRSEKYATLLAGLKVEHFGKFGTAFVLRKVGVAQAKQDFLQRAKQLLSRHFHEQPKSLEELVRSGSARSRAGAVAEYALDIPGRRTLLSGTIIRENAAPPLQTSQQSRWLCTADLLRVGSHVHRGLRGEALALEEICSLALAGDSSSGAHTRGSLRLFSSSYPCVSCIGAIMQFRQVFPLVQVEAANGGPSIGVHTPSDES